MESQKTQSIKRSISPDAQTEGKPNTGSAFLDELLADLSCETLSAMYIMTRLLSVNTVIGNKALDYQKLKAGQFREGKFPPNTDSEFEVLPATKWLSFGEGLEIEII
jgi:hypothetical protein